jgi:hypothetical protein
LASSKHVAEALGGAAEGSYEQEAAVVEEGEEMEVWRSYPTPRRIKTQVQF